MGIKMDSAVFDEHQELKLVSTPSLDYKWNVNGTKTLIDLYSKYQNKVGTLQVKTRKMLWQIIAQELNKLGIWVNANNCMNRWKVVERNYKRFVDNQKKTGRGRKYFEYEEEMNEIFGQKRNIHPEILLTAETVDNPIEVDEEASKEMIQVATASSVMPSKQATNRTRVFKKKMSSIEKMRLDRKTHYDARLEIEKEKLAEIKKRSQLIEERNKILKEKNSILKNLKCSCNCNSLL